MLHHPEDVALLPCPTEDVPPPYSTQDITPPPYSTVDVGAHPCLAVNVAPSPKFVEDIASLSGLAEDINPAHVGLLGPIASGYLEIF